MTPLKHRIGPVVVAIRGERARLFGAKAAAMARVSWHIVWRAARALTSPAAIVVLMLISGSACTVAGVWMLVGTAWALIAAAAVLFVLSGLALRGMLNG